MAGMANNLVMPMTNRADRRREEYKPHANTKKKWVRGKLFVGADEVEGQRTYQRLRRDRKRLEAKKTNNND